MTLKRSEELSGGPLARQRIQVAMGDSDAAGVIYYATPLRWTDSLMMQWHADGGLSMSDLLADAGGTRTVHAEVTHLGPIRPMEWVEATLWCHRRSTRSFTLRSEFRLEGAASVSSQVLITQVYVPGGADRAAALPGWLGAHVGDVTAPTMSIAE